MAPTLHWPELKFFDNQFVIQLSLSLFSNKPVNLLSFIFLLFSETYSLI